MSKIDAMNAIDNILVISGYLMSSAQSNISINDKQVAVFESAGMRELADKLMQAGLALRREFMEMKADEN